MIRKQLDVLARLEAESRRDVRRLEDERGDQLVRLWTGAAGELKAKLMRSHAAGHPDGKWDVAEALYKGTLRRMQDDVSEVLVTFRVSALRLISEALREVRLLEVRRQMWAIDQVTPPGIFAKRPADARYREADQKPGDNWETNASESIDAYAAALARNLRLAAVSGSSPDKIADVVDGTRVGYPAFTMPDTLARVYTTAAISQQAQAQLDVSDANEDVVQEEVWQTLEDENVCPICDSYFGRTRDDIERNEGDSIPAHPNDRCFWRLVPKEWAELLRSGDEFQRAMALEIDNQGLVDDSMAIYGVDGKSLIGTTVVRFEDWDQSVAQREYDLWKAQWEQLHPAKGAVR